MRNVTEVETYLQTWILEMVDSKVETSLQTGTKPKEDLVKAVNTAFKTLILEQDGAVERSPEFGMIIAELYVLINRFEEMSTYDDCYIETDSDGKTGYFMIDLNQEGRVVPVIRIGAVQHAAGQKIKKFDVEVKWTAQTPTEMIWSLIQFENERVRMRVYAEDNVTHHKEDRMSTTFYLKKR